MIDTTLSDPDLVGFEEDNGEIVVHVDEDAHHMLIIRFKESDLVNMLAELRRTK